MGSKENICKEENYHENNGNNAEEKKRDKKDDTKLVRFVTVIAYLVSVSTPAMILSTYYLFLWESPTFHQNRTTHH